MTKPFVFINSSLIRYQQEEDTKKLTRNAEKCKMFAQCIYLCLPFIITFVTVVYRKWLKCAVEIRTWETLFLSQKEKTKRAKNNVMTHRFWSNHRWWTCVTSIFFTVQQVQQLQLFFQTIFVYLFFSFPRSYYLFSSPRVITTGEDVEKT